MSTDVVRRDPAVAHVATAAAGIVVPIAVEVWFLGKYAAAAASWHWYVHFFAGATCALILMAWWSWRHRRAVSFPLVWILLAHVYAAAPDLVIPENIPHKPWQEVFLGHLASHYLPGRGLSWLVVFAIALGGYLLILDRRTAPQPRPDRLPGRRTGSAEPSGSRRP